MSHVLCHMSHVTRQVSVVIFFFLSSFYKVLESVSRGLPRLVFIQYQDLVQLHLLKVGGFSPLIFDPSACCVMNENMMSLAICIFREHVLT